MERRRRNVRWADMDKDAIPLKLLIEQYDTHNQIEGKSQRTNDWYNYSLHEFLTYLEDQDLSSHLGDIGRRHVQEFILHLQSKRKWDNHPSIDGREDKLSPESIRTKVRALRAFFAWLHREEFTEELHLGRARARERSDLFHGFGTSADGRALAGRGIVGVRGHSLP